MGWRLGDLAGWAALPAYLLFAWLAVGLVWIDADVHRLPDGLVLPAYPALLVLVVVATAGLGQWSALWRALACLAALWLLYFVMHLISPGSLGFGDVKLSGLIGLLMGWLGVGHAAVAVMAGFLVGGADRPRHAGRPASGADARTSRSGPSMLVGAFVALVVEYHVVA